MKLHDLEKLVGTRRRKKRLGRGIGSGKGGHTVGRGAKGQKARKGNSKPNVGFEGGQVPLYKRLPQLGGFKVFRKNKNTPISLDLLDRVTESITITPSFLKDKGYINYLSNAGAKILATGKLTKKITIKGFTMSKTAREMIEKSGSKILE